MSWCCICKKQVNDLACMQFNTLIEDGLSQNDYLFTPESLEPTMLSERKKRDLGRVLRYIPDEFNGFYGGR